MRTRITHQDVDGHGRKFRDKTFLRNPAAGWNWSAKCHHRLRSGEPIPRKSDHQAEWKEGPEIKLLICRPQVQDTVS